jgi:hypothetical protein
MANSRMAMGLAKLGDLLKDILPQSKGELALRLGPEAGFALISAGMAPEGTPLSDRIALAAEDMLIGAGSSVLGSAAGRGAGELMYPASKYLKDPTERAKKLSQAMTAGDILAAPLPMFAPRPIATGVYERAMEGQSRQEQEQLLAQEEERLMQEALLSSLLTGGGALLT